MRRSWQRIIAHADMDAFYAAVEQLDDPKLRGRPLLVGPRSHRGVVLTASYEARPFGVHSAMPMARARKLCPDALIVPPRFERYTQISQQIMSVFGDFSPDVEALSLDEAFLDMSGSEHLFGDPRAMGRKIKDAVKEATGLAVSVGLSGTKYVAKVASDYGKPDGLVVVRPEDAEAWLAPLSVARLWGAGPKTQQRLIALGFATIGDIAKATPGELDERLGSVGRRFYALAHGEDPREVAVSRRSKSVGSDRTLAQDIHRRADIVLHLHHSADDVARRLRRRGYVAAGVRVKLKTHDFRLMTRQRRLPRATDVAATLHAQAVALLDDFDDAGPFRLVGLAAYDLDRVVPDAQLDIFADGRRRRLETAIDTLTARFGRDSVRRASGLRDGVIQRIAPNLDFLDVDADDV
ncbi:MAG TPA: DNA polymerase IV [Pseudomonadales bacterium]|nr:DNA polymerase IV [Pseudomonadales bacterium]